MINQLKNYKDIFILLTVFPVGLFLISPTINITVISAAYENDGGINISIQYMVKKDMNITTPSSALFDVTILSIKDDSGRVDDPDWEIGYPVFMVALIHQLRPGIHSYQIEGRVYTTIDFGLGTPYGCIPPQIPSEITFMVSIGEDFYSSPYTTYLDT